MVMIVNVRVIMVFWVGLMVKRLWWGSITVFNMMMFMVGWRRRRSIMFFNNMMVRLVMGGSIMLFNMVRVTMMVLKMVGLMVNWWRSIVFFHMMRFMMKWRGRSIVLFNMMVGWAMVLFHNMMVFMVMGWSKVFLNMVGVMMWWSIVLLNMVVGLRMRRRGWRSIMLFHMMMICMG